MIGEMHRPEIHQPMALAPGVRLTELHEVAPLAPMDVAERFRDLPGLVLLESARPGRNARWTYLTADPVAILDAPSEGPDAFASARRLLRRLTSDPVPGPSRAAVPRWAREASSATTWDGDSSGCRPSPRPTRSCRRCASRSTTG